MQQQQHCLRMTAAAAAAEKLPVFSPILKWMIKQCQRSPIFLLSIVFPHFRPDRRTFTFSETDSTQTKKIQSFKGLGSISFNGPKGLNFIIDRLVKKNLLAYLALLLISPLDGMARIYFFHLDGCT